MPQASPLPEDKDKSKIKFAAIIPAYNEEKTIRGLVEETINQMGRVVVVNDGSADNTCQQLENLPIELLSYTDNQRKAYALWRGFHLVLESESELEGVITLDGDGQHLPEDIPRLVDAYSEFPDHLIIGTRTRDWGLFPPIRRWANQLANLGVSLAAGCRVPDTQSGFRLYPASLLRILQADSDRYSGFVFESEVIIEAVKLGFKIHSIPIAAVYGNELRKSHFRPARDTIEIGKMIVGKIASRILKSATSNSTKG
jgi:glycosyltransferase involved in cell wall biosynthesis